MEVHNSDVMRCMMAVVFICLLSSLSFAVVWDDSTAWRRVCFNATGTGTIYGKEWSTPWTVFDVALPKNETFFDSNLFAEFGFFKYTENATHVFIALPAVTNLTSQEYCIYSGGQDTEGLDIDVAAVYYADAKESWWNTSGVTFGNYINVTSNTSTASYTRAAVLSSYPSAYIKMRTNVTTIGTGSSVPATYAGFGPYSALSTTTCSDCVQLFSNHTWMFGGRVLYQDTGLDNWRILTTYTSSTGFNASIRDENMTLLGNNSRVIALSVYPVVAYAKNASVLVDWAFAGKSDSTYAPGQSNVRFEFQDTNITFVSPAWGTSFSVDDSVPIGIYFNRAYTSCNLTLDGVVADTFVPLAGDIVDTNLDMAPANPGDNYVVVNCTLGGAYYHRYLKIIRTGSSAVDVFTLAFGNNPINLGCPTNASIELEKCFEGYNLSKRVDFAAVICRNLNLTGGYNYTCLQARNVSKNNYTIFFRPHGFEYPGLNGSATLNIQHVGASFIYYGTSLEPGIEIISANDSANDSYFVYIPAQYRDRDCNVYFMNATACSWGNGFVLNHGDIILSDRANNWYVAGSSGIEPFSGTYSQQVLSTTVYSIITDMTDLFANGIYTRLNCYVNNLNQTFEVRIKNTLLKNYTYYSRYTGIPPTNQTSESYMLYRSTNITSLEQVIVYDTNEGQELCRYQNSTTMFLPFVMPDEMMPDGFPIITWAIMIFMTVLTSIVPFAAILMVIWNDVYHMLNISQISLVCLLSILFGFVNASFNMERGIKHMLIILAIATAYLAAISPYADDEGIDISGFDDSINSFNSLRGANDLPGFIAGIPQFVISLFTLVLMLPITLVDFTLAMLKYISIPIWNAAKSIAPFITVGLVLYFYLKAYEVLSNRFRIV